MPGGAVERRASLRPRPPVDRRSPDQPQTNEKAILYGACCIGIRDAAARVALRGGSIAGLTDRQLLERYAADGRSPAGEAAFAALVARHGPMVLGVCRQLLGDHHHAEDAFQAVFLVLSQKARSIRDADLLGNWLYGVAIRTARCAKQQIARRRRREEGDTMSGPGAGLCAPAEPAAPPADRPAIDREQAEAIHVAIDRLPRAFRSAVVLCYFEGLTLDEAARRLRCPAGTLRSRLARAREKLRISLARRGVVLPAAALAAVCAAVGLGVRSSAALRFHDPGRDPVRGPSRRRRRPVGSRRGTGTGGPSNHVALQDQARRFFVVAPGSAAAGGGWAARSLASKDGPHRMPPVRRLAARASILRRLSNPMTRMPGRMFVSGQVSIRRESPFPGCGCCIRYTQVRSLW